MDERPVEQIVREDGTFAFFDGTSVYTLQADGTFRLTPAGMSGRTIEGCYRFVEGSNASVEVVGRWSWINGISARNDYRRMRFTVSPLHRPVSPDEVMGREHVFDSVFEMEELRAITPAAYEEGMQTCHRAH